MKKMVNPRGEEILSEDYLEDRAPIPILSTPVTYLLANFGSVSHYHHISQFMKTKPHTYMHVHDHMVHMYMITRYTHKPLVLSLWRTGLHVPTCHSRVSSKHNPAPHEHASSGEPGLEVTVHKYVCSVSWWSGIRSYWF